MIAAREKYVANGNEQVQFNVKHHLSAEFFASKNVVVLFVAACLLTAMVTSLAVFYWWTRTPRSSKRSSHPSELIAFSSIKGKSPDPVTFSSLVTTRVQPLPLKINEEPVTAKKARKKNLLQRRGSNNSLSISIDCKHRTINSPPMEHSSDEYLQTATRKLTIDELHQHAYDTYLLSHEFWTIPTNHLEKLRICGAGTKNRYGTIIANEHSRVKLPELSGDPVTSYINANYVHGWPDEHHAYIATQGPLANTIVDFYRMIWQENVPVIVMITRLLENNKSKCERYIPDDRGDQYGSFHVHIKSTVHHRDCEVRRLVIEFDGKHHEIDHYWYTAWPDQSCPDECQSLIELVHHVERSRTELSTMNRRTGPVVVHCSAGIGRTGCYIALSNGIKQLDTEHEVDVVRILCNLRRDRGGMVQTNDQYQFLYQALSAHARTLS